MVPYIQEHFKKQGWEMDIFFLPKRIRNKGKERVPFATIDVDWMRGLSVVDKYEQTIRDYLWWSKLRIQKPYDLIHAHHPIAALVMKHLFPETPIMITLHSSFESELILNGNITKDGPEHSFLTSLYRELEVKLDKIITVSHTFKNYVAQFVIDGSQIEVIPNGFDQERFQPIAHDNPVPQLLTLCRLVPAKGLDLLLKACAILKEQGYRFVLHIIGDGPIREELEKMAVRLDIYEETIFYGYMLHPEDFMPFFDIFVLPSRAEAFGSVFAEAALSWVTLVGTNIGGISEQIEHEHNGLLVPVDNVDELANAIERLITDVDLRYRLAENAWKKATNEYSMFRVIQRLEKIYRSFSARPC